MKGGQRRSDQGVGHLRSHIADFFTVCNGLAGLLAMLYIIDGAPEARLIAAQLILVGMLLDGIDGMVARQLGTVHEYGIKLDAICDVITFCFAPGFLLYSVYYDPNQTSFQSVDNASVVVAVLLLCGLGTLRLARGRNGSGNGSRGRSLDAAARHFKGLPTSYAAYVSIGLVFTVSDPMLTAMVVGLLSVLMYSSINFLRPKGLPTTLFFLFVIFYGELVL